jgi:hypothetical protein
LTFALGNTSVPESVLRRSNAPPKVPESVRVAVLTTPTLVALKSVMGPVQLAVLAAPTRRSAPRGLPLLSSPPSPLRNRISLTVRLPLIDRAAPLATVVEPKALFRALLFWIFSTPMLTNVLPV